MLNIGIYELHRLIANKRGWLAIASLSLFWLGVLYYFILKGASWMKDDDSRYLMQNILDKVGVAAWYEWSSVEMALYCFFIVLIMPVLLVFWSADQTASDRQRGTLRFLILRSSRSSLFLGRFFGHVLIAFILISGMSLTVLLSIVVRGSFSLDVLMSLLITTLNGCIAALPVIAMMAWLSISSSSPRQAILLAFLLYLGAWIAFSIISYNFPSLSFVHYLRPAYYAFDLIKVAEWNTLLYTPIPILQTLLFITLGLRTISREEL